MSFIVEIDFWLKIVVITNEKIWISSLPLQWRNSITWISDAAAFLHYLCKVRVTFVTLQEVHLIRINYGSYYVFLWWKSALICWIHLQWKCASCRKKSYFIIKRSWEKGLNFYVWHTKANSCRFPYYFCFTWVMLQRIASRM